MDAGWVRRWVGLASACSRPGRGGAEVVVVGACVQVGVAAAAANRRAEEGAAGSKDVLGVVVAAAAPLPVPVWNRPLELVCDLRVGICQSAPRINKRPTSPRRSATVTVLRTCMFSA